MPFKTSCITQQPKAPSLREGEFKMVMGTILTSLPANGCQDVGGSLKLDCRELLGKALTDKVARVGILSVQH